MATDADNELLTRARKGQALLESRGYDELADVIKQLIEKAFPKGQAKQEDEVFLTPPMS